jgi:predicted small secreted protein
MKFVISIVTLVFLSGCATWSGIKKDTSDGAEWTKEKINKGAEYVKEKTE